MSDRSGWYEWLPTHGHEFRATSDGHGGYDDECQACGFAAGQHEVSDRITAAGDEETGWTTDVDGTVHLAPRYGGAPISLAPAVANEIGLKAGGDWEYPNALDLLEAVIQVVRQVDPEGAERVLAELPVAGGSA